MIENINYPIYTINFMYYFYISILLNFPSYLFVNFFSHSVPNGNHHFKTNSKLIIDT